jgi:hypothetical protein
MKKIVTAVIFFVGWIFSPFTWWNDSFVNIPLSYVMAHILFYGIHLPFSWLVLGSYWFTNIIGIVLMYVSGKPIVTQSHHRTRTIAIFVLTLLIYSLLLFYLDKKCLLLPFNELLKKIFP